MEKQEIYNTLNEAYFSDDHHEQAVIENLPSILTDVKTFVDTGASLGQYTYYVNKIIENGQIISVEADPIRHEKLNSNCAEWSSVTSNTLTAFHGAMSDEDGEITFFTTNSNVSGGLFTHDVRNNDVTWQEITVKSYTLDTLLADYDPDLIKIDVEGSELRVLNGATRILTEGKAKFLIELHSFVDPASPGGPDEVIRFMKAYGYTPTNFHGQKLFAKSAAAQSGSDPVVNLLVSKKPEFQLKTGTTDIKSSEQYFLSGGRETAQAARASHSIAKPVLDYLASVVKPHHTTLETGGGYSTVVFGSKSKQHICVNPDITANGLIKDFLEQNKFSASSVTFVQESSDRGLAQLELNSTVDIALIDGNHSFPLPIIDWHFIDPLLSVGGKLIVDDTHINAVKVLTDFLDVEPSYKLIERLDRTLVYEKVTAQRTMGWADQPISKLEYVGWVDGAQKSADAPSAATNYHPWLDFAKQNPNLAAELPTYPSLVADIEASLATLPNRSHSMGARLKVLWTVGSRILGRKLGGGSSR